MPPHTCKTPASERSTVLGWQPGQASCLVTIRGTLVGPVIISCVPHGHSTCLDGYATAKIVLLSDEYGCPVHPKGRPLYDTP